MKINNRILIATGGTGGHVFPAYSLAKHFIKKDYFVKITTDKRGLNYLKNYSDIKVKTIISATPFNKNLLSSFFSFFILAYSFVQSLVFLSKYKPNVVFGMGGYASFPVCIAAKFLRIPFVTYENNLFIGKTNKYLLPFAYKMFISYPELEGVNQKYKHKIAIVGNIIREEILNYNQDKNNSYEGKLNILILGGSQAAKSFGEKLPEIFKRCLSENIQLKVFQQCLKSQNKNLEKEYISLKIEHEIFNFSHSLINYFSKANLVITRSGSSMLAELLNCNIPIISVPLPSSADNHQLKNANFFEKKGYSFLVEEKEIEKKLFPLIKSIHEDKEMLNHMKKRQNNYSDKNIFKNIDSQINNLLND